MACFCQALKRRRCVWETMKYVMVIKFKFFLTVAILGLVLSPVIQTTAFGGEDATLKVVAVVGQEEITQADIEKFTKKIPEPFRKTFAGKVLEQLIDSKIFYKAAINEGLDRTPEFKARLEKEKERILAVYFLEKRISSKITVSSSEVTAYYEKNRNKFKQKPMLRPAQILVKSRKEAEAIKGRLKKGEPFEKLADECSIIPGKKEGGDLGWMKRGRMPKPFEDTAFGLKKGGVSDIIKTDMGYVIIKILDKKDGTEKSFEDVKPLIEKRLKAMKMGDIKKEYRKRAGVRIIDEKYKKVFPLK